jgi:hypothetical protein
MPSPWASVVLNRRALRSSLINRASGFAAAILERGDLRFGEHEAVLCHLGFERFEAVFH